jgi:DNA-binding beta-propeller fold protein YncE
MFNLSAQADILIGNYGSGTSHESLRAFSDDANGDVAPIRSLGGTNSTLIAPIGGQFAAGEGVVYVADFWGQAIRVFPAYADGDVAPLRVLDAPILGQTRTLTLDTLHGEIITTASGCCVTGFMLDASGSAPWLHMLNWGGGAGSVTQLNYPPSLTYLDDGDEVAVVDSDIGPPYAPKVLVFNRTDAGNTAPKRVIKGGQTGFGNWVTGITWDAGAHLLYVAANTSHADSTVSARILAFDDQADGDVAPLRTIAGPSTQLELGAGASIRGLAIDPIGQRLIASVSHDTDPLANKLLLFNLVADGDIAPVQVVAGAQTGMHGIGTPIWVPADAIMHDGFD